MGHQRAPFGPHPPTKLLPAHPAHLPSPAQSLQDSLGGNCRTTLVATVSPSCEAFDESCSTLRFADRARAIANNPVVNASRDVGSVLALKEKEIQRLRQMLTQMQGGPQSASGVRLGAAQRAQLGAGRSRRGRAHTLALAMPYVPCIHGPRRA